MRKVYQLAAVLSTVIIFSSCKKDEIKITPLSSINITNAILGGISAKLGSNAATISNNANTQFGLVAGQNNLYVYPSSDSAHPYYTNDKFSTSQGEVYSLFLSGTPVAVDAVLLKETIPYRTDSTAGIRFINLAPNTSNKALNITLSTTHTVNEVSNLAYKQLTDFTSYAGLYNSTYTFQIRNDTSAAPKPPLATFAFTAAQVPRFANITLVIRQDGANGLSIFRVNNDR